MLEPFKQEGLWTLHDNLWFDDGRFHSWLIVKSLADRYEHIERNDILSTSSRDYILLKQHQFSTIEQILTKKNSSFDSLWI